jgi:hypothetical protein
VVEPSELYELHIDDFEVPAGLHLIAGLTGFTDAGSTIEQFANHIFENLEHRCVALFDNDELLDYRSRRPVMYFEKDHISSYEPSVLALYLVTDEVGQKFLFLHGYEPDFKWESFTQSIFDLVDIFDIEDFSWVHSIPFPIPHSRSVGVTISGNRKELIERVSEWKPQTQVPGNVLHLLEFRFAEEDFPTAGFVMLVPHYLSDLNYPQAAVKAFEQISSTTSLVFPTDTLREAGYRFIEDLERKISDNPELAKLVASLENGFSAEEGNSRGPRIRSPKTEVPSAEEIASELEDYLSLRRKQSDQEDL